MARGHIAKWVGGYVRKTAAGRPVFYILKRIAGRLYELSTRRSTESAALSELQRFEHDPARYTPTPPADERLELDDDLAQEFITWSREEKGNTHAWVLKQRNALAWWGARLERLDLRRIDVRADLKPHLATATGKAHKIAVLKAFYAWLRTEKFLVKLADDPVAGVLRAPPARAEQHQRSKVIPLDNYRTVMREHLEGPLGELGVGAYRAALLVLANTAWHVTELERFAKGGSIEPIPQGREAEGDAVLFCPRHKGGAAHRTVVKVHVAMAAAEILTAHFSAQMFARELKAACLRAGVPHIDPGSFRHTVLTFALEHGNATTQGSDFAGHKSATTTRRHYTLRAAPPKIRTLDD